MEREIWTCAGVFTLVVWEEQGHKCSTLLQSLGATLVYRWNWTRKGHIWPYSTCLPSSQRAWL